MRGTLIQTASAQDTLEPSAKVVAKSTGDIASIASGLEKLAEIARGTERDLSAVSGHLAELDMQSLVDRMAVDLTRMLNFKEIARYDAGLIKDLLVAADRPILFDALRQGEPDLVEKLKGIIVAVEQNRIERSRLKNGL